MVFKLLRSLASFAILGAVAGCAAGHADDPLARAAKPVTVTKAGRLLTKLPPAGHKTRVAVYSIADKTGQRKASETVALLSTAVTQGTEDILLDVLRRAGRGSWFEVVERAGLRNVLQERKIAELNLKRVNDEHVAADREDMVRELDRLERELTKSKVAQFNEKEDLKLREIDFAVAQARDKDKAAAALAKSLIEAQERQEAERRARFDKIQKADEAKLESLAQGKGVNAQLEQVRAGLANAIAQERERRTVADAQIAKARAEEHARKQRVAKEIADLQLRREANGADSKAGAITYRIESLRRRITDQLNYLKERKPHDLPPMKVAKYVIEGAVVGYDTNETTKGIGARFLGIGGDKKYRHDIVTVALRLVDVRNGEVLASASSTKHIYAVLIQGGVYQYVAVDKILEVEGGLSRNEPTTLAVRHAVEHALHEIIPEGVERGVWNFADAAAGADYVAKWRAKTERPLLTAGLRN
ncbi:MAG: CsgG/HfaB family protein [Hyphomicrobiaceae bacterium]